MNTHPNIWCFCCFFTIALKLFTMRSVCQDSSNALQLTDYDCCFCRWHTKHCLVSCLMLYFVCFCLNIQIFFFFVEHRLIGYHRYHIYTFQIQSVHFQSTWIASFHNNIIFSELGALQCLCLCAFYLNVEQPLKTRHNCWVLKILQNPRAT